MKPQRIQRRRTKGFKLPDNTVYVGRPTKWGNPFKIGDKYSPALEVSTDLRVWILCENNKMAVDIFRKWVDTQPEYIEQVKTELKGKNLACFCSLDQPCHADILLELANK